MGGQQQGTECRDGVTPPMRDARRRMFANLPAVDSAVMRKLEEDLLTIAMVHQYISCCMPRHTRGMHACMPLAAEQMLGRHDTLSIIVLLLCFLPAREWHAPKILSGLSGLAAHGVPMRMVI